MQSSMTLHTGNFWRQEQSGSPSPPGNAYVAEDGVTYYVAEDGVTYYVQEA